MDPLSLHHHRLLAAAIGFASVGGSHVQIQVVLTLAALVPEAAGMTQTLFVDVGLRIEGRLGLCFMMTTTHVCLLHTHCLEVSQSTLAEEVVGLPKAGFGTDACVSLFIKTLEQFCMTTHCR